MTFDWTTFAFQLVNVVVLLAILRHVLFRPVAEVIARRQAQTDAALQSAEQARAEAEAATQKAQAEAQANAAARHDVLLAAQAEAEKQRNTILDQARADAARILAEGRAAHDRDLAADEARALDRARELSANIARRALAAQPRDLAGYAERLSQALQALPAPERAALLAGADLRLVSPAPLSPAEQDAAMAALAPFGLHPANAVDADLIAGLELHSEAGAIRNSLAHDLDRISRAMRDDRTA